MTIEELKKYINEEESKKSDADLRNADPRNAGDADLRNADFSNMVVEELNH